MCPWRKPIQVQLFRYRAFAGFFSLLCVYAYLSLIVVFFFCLLSVWFVSTSGEFYFIFFLIPAAAVFHRRDKNRMKRSRTEEGEKSARCPPCIFTSKIERIKEEGKETLSHSSVVIWDSQAEGRLNTLRNTKRVRRQKHIRIFDKQRNTQRLCRRLGRKEVFVLWKSREKKRNAAKYKHKKGDFREFSWTIVVGVFPSTQRKQRVKGVKWSSYGEYKPVTWKGKAPLSINVRSSEWENNDNKQERKKGRKAGRSQRTEHETSQSIPVDQATVMTIDQEV